MIAGESRRFEPTQAILDKDRLVNRDGAWPSDIVVGKIFLTATTGFPILKGRPPSERAILPAHSGSSFVPWAVQQPVRARLCHQRFFPGPHLAAEDRFRNFHHTGGISLAASSEFAGAFGPTAH